MNLCLGKEIEIFTLLWLLRPQEKKANYLNQECCKTMNFGRGTEDCEMLIMNKYKSEMPENMENGKIDKYRMSHWNLCLQM